MVDATGFKFQDTVKSLVQRKSRHRKVGIPCLEPASGQQPGAKALDREASSIHIVFNSHTRIVQLVRKGIREPELGPKPTKGEQMPGLQWPTFSSEPTGNAVRSLCQGTEQGVETPISRR